MRLSVAAAARLHNVGGTFSARDVAHARGVNRSEFSIRELFAPPPQDPPRMLPDTWDNWISDHDTSSLRVRPENREELIGIVQFAAENDRGVRAVGSGHSHSNAARPRQGASNIFVDLMNLGGLLDDNNWLKPNHSELGSHENTVRIRAGTTIKELNRNILPHRDQGLHNMGSFDGQTIAGAISTATHGTGVRLPTLADMVMSVEIVTVVESPFNPRERQVQLYRIEPTNGITDPEKFAADYDQHGMLLEQDDDLFYSVVVSYGCMGIACAYTLKIRTEFWLEEELEQVSWNALRSQLNGPTESVPGAGTFPRVTTESRHFSFLLNIAAAQGIPVPPSDQVEEISDLIERIIERSDNPLAPSVVASLQEFSDLSPDQIERSDNPSCLIQRLKGPKPTHTNPPERRAKQVQQIISDNFAPDPEFSNRTTPVVAPWVAALVATSFKREPNRPSFENRGNSSASYIALRRERDDTGQFSAPEPPPMAISTEIAVPATKVAAAVDVIIDHLLAEKDVFFAVPAGIRFTAPSSHYLAPQFNRPSAMIEIPLLVNVPQRRIRRETNGELRHRRDNVAKKALEKIELLLCDGNDGAFGGRPHLGKYHTVNRDRLKEMYPNSFEKWETALKRFNPFGLFNNDFTDQLGLSQ